MEKISTVNLLGTLFVGIKQVRWRKKDDNDSCRAVLLKSLFNHAKLMVTGVIDPALIEFSWQ